MFSSSQALKHWNINASHAPSTDQGLINKTYIVSSIPKFVLQWVNPIFDPRIHLDLHLILKHLSQQGVTTPTLQLLPNGDTYLPDERGCWRIWTFIEGTTLHNIPHTSIAKAAGEIVGQFHRGLSALDHKFVSNRRDIHNTPQRMNDLRSALEIADGHPLEVPCRKLGEAILNTWSQWEGTMDLPRRLTHGDLKISNILFNKKHDQGVALIDLDTIGYQSLASEMGDAWRSWCNPAGEGKPDEASFDPEIFAASLYGWANAGPAITSLEKENLVAGIERICLELSARFCADAINNTYFAEDRNKYPQKGQHNLIRAQSQFNLGQSARKHKKRCEAIVNTTPLDIQ